jgi:hypothetical protein
MARAAWRRLALATLLLGAMSTEAQQCSNPEGGRCAGPAASALLPGLEMPLSPLYSAVFAPPTSAPILSTAMPCRERGPARGSKGPGPQRRHPGLGRRHLPLQPVLLPSGGLGGRRVHRRRRHRPVRPRLGRAHLLRSMHAAESRPPRPCAASQYALPGLPRQLQGRQPDGQPARIPQRPRQPGDPVSAHPGRAWRCQGHSSQKPRLALLP